MGDHVDTGRTTAEPVGIDIDGRVAGSPHDGARGLVDLLGVAEMARVLHGHGSLVVLDSRQ